MIIEEFFKNMENVDDELAIKLFRAVQMVCRYQSQQRRESGESYLIHLFDVSYQLYNIELPDHAIIGGILHDLPEDVKNFDPRRIKKIFGEETYGWVMALTKKPKNQFPSKEERLFEYHQRIIKYATEVDWTVIFGKCADRLNNLVTLDGLRHDPFKQERISLETQKFYVPFLQGGAKKIVPPEYHKWLDFYAFRMGNLANSYLEGNIFIQIPV